MGKNKAKSQMQKNVFHVANKRIMKAKSKAKPVTTSLKKINIVNDEKVNMVNKIFTEVQKEVKQLSKAIPSDPSKRNQAHCDDGIHANSGKTNWGGRKP
uniref:Ribosomal biogenesis factor n=1 Tax=Varanus komodoensis TaxID=61221 RepID=A0A8D2IPP2_VARKO